MTDVTNGLRLPRLLVASRWGGLGSLLERDPTVLVWIENPGYAPVRRWRNRFDLAILDASNVRLIKAAKERGLAVIALGIPDVDDLAKAYEELEVDDFQFYPIPSSELAARARAICRRSMPQPPPPRHMPLTFGPLVLDPDTYQPLVGGERLRVWTQQRFILRLLVGARGGVVDREELAHPWMHLQEPFPHLRAAISALRELLAENQINVGIRVVSGVGYHLALTL